MEVHIVRPKSWSDLVELFERKGPRAGVHAVTCFYVDREARGTGDARTLMRLTF
ncbi:hypothetical protein OG474_39245 [Kribbella sp. NBC_01505]|uniref:hypothetical protein n=1 Tax=Kribbella sp. NBC_01505 TaxID=2903580 RepID=UPI003866AFC8